MRRRNFRFAQRAAASARRNGKQPASGRNAIELFRIAHCNGRNFPLLLESFERAVASGAEFEFLFRRNFRNADAVRNILFFRPSIRLSFTSTNCQCKPEHHGRQRQVVDVNFGDVTPGWCGRKGLLSHSYSDRRHNSLFMVFGQWCASCGTRTFHCRRHHGHADRSGSFVVHR